MPMKQMGCCCPCTCLDASVNRDEWVLDIGINFSSDATAGNCCQLCDDLNGEFILPHTAAATWSSTTLCDWFTNVCNGCIPPSSFSEIILVQNIFLNIFDEPGGGRCRYEAFIQLFITIPKSNLTCPAGNWVALYKAPFQSTFGCNDEDDITTWLTLDKDSDTLTGNSVVCNVTAPATIRIRRN